MVLLIPADGLLFHGNGEAIGCVGINGPVVRVTRRRVGILAERALEAAGLLSAMLGETMTHYPQH